MKPHVVKFFQFLEDREDKKLPLKTKLLNADKFNFTKGDLIVKGDLSLSGTDIKSLPNGLQVSESLFLNDCTSLTSLPNSLYVGRNLSLYNCKSLNSLPSTLYVVSGDLDLMGCTSLTSLPDDLQVSGELNLYGCSSLESLPNGLHVTGNLSLSMCVSLTSIPDGLRVGKNLHLTNTPLAKMHSADEIRAMIEATGGCVGRSILI